MFYLVYDIDESFYCMINCCFFEYYHVLPIREISNMHSTFFSARV